LLSRNSKQGRRIKTSWILAHGLNEFSLLFGLANILIECEYLTRGSLLIYPPAADKRSVIIRPNRIISRQAGQAVC